MFTPELIRYMADNIAITFMGLPENLEELTAIELRDLCIALKFNSLHKTDDEILRELRNLQVYVKEYTLSILKENKEEFNYVPTYEKIIYDSKLLY